MHGTALPRASCGKKKVFSGRNVLPLMFKYCLPKFALRWTESREADGESENKAVPLTLLHLHLSDPSITSSAFTHLRSPPYCAVNCPAVRNNSNIHLYLAYLFTSWSSHFQQFSFLCLGFNQWMVHFCQNHLLIFIPVIPSNSCSHCHPRCP